jgi:hypothetical protein
LVLFFKKRTASFLHPIALPSPLQDAFKSPAMAAGDAAPRQSLLPDTMVAVPVKIYGPPVGRGAAMAFDIRPAPIIDARARQE